MSLRSFLAAALACVVLVGCASEEPAATASEAHVGPLANTGTASCVEAYTAEAVAGRGFAFDGTVVSIADGTTNRPGKGRLNLAGVTFAVDSWYVGGPTSTVTIDMAPPGGGGSRLDEVPPTYEVGTRLLVSGESRWGEGVLQDGLAWGCGFSRYYDVETAAEWRDAME